MQRCLQIAANGLGTTYPNPLVGSVIVYKNQIIGEGWHRKSGERHAEILAINSVKDQSLLSKSTLYVNLEPCAHYGKTPPCAHKIVEMKIPKVVIGTRDFSAKVNGKGVEYLTKHGVEVTEGICEKDAKFLNRRFFTFHLKKRPYIILKAAQTQNGFMAPKDRSQQWITGLFSKQMVHKWRTEEQAVIVGKNTVVSDEPQLTARVWIGENQPLRMTISKEVDFNTYSFLKYENSVIFTSVNKSNSDNKQLIALDFSENVLTQIMDYLFAKNIQSIIVEGGAYTLQRFIDENLWDEARILTSNVRWNDGIKTPLLPFSHMISEKKSGNDMIQTFLNTSDDI